MMSNMSERKLNAYNYRIERDAILETDEKEEIVIGSNIENIEPINNINSKKPNKKGFKENYDVRKIKQFVFDSGILKDLKDVNIKQVQVDYYPFNDKTAEDSYVKYYFNKHNIFKVLCPTCNQRYNNCYLLNGYIFQCSECYNSKKIIN